MTKGIFAGLQALPLISFTLLLGAEMVVTAFAVWFGRTLSYGDWPEGIAETRVRMLGSALLLSLGLIGLVLVTLGLVGRLTIDKVSINTDLGGGEIDFADEPSSRGGG